ncbi:energy-coupling factor transporter ATPase [Criibacterium bergeronii]|uniref:Energy-coupling factor transporter ATP-binding protein EcfA2 n=1 Tax=Criibacterium bergeronii TaxID=1871336 RepID=A0A552V0R3_9FIRM|nr:energy-coupling factor transporter ATPase [Criibacterium bergeronii]TRW24057.1 energy-coupling factor transporter ATPase [Criibacterium bergeronii]
MSIVVSNLNFIYSPNTPFETVALKNVSFEIKTGEFVALIGHTGSGKSTLIQQLNGLIKPTSGSIVINGVDITKQNAKLTEVRRKVGLVFQYPEYQLFDETVQKDIAFGPKNMGLSDEEINKRVKTSMDLVGMSFEKYKDKSPFELSGGQKRRVAIAGVLAMSPEVLILDEPAAGLDPKAKNEILGNIKKIHAKTNNTIILVSHCMSDVSEIADRLLVMNKGQIEYFDTPVNVFKNEERLKEIGLDVPDAIKLKNILNKCGYSISDEVLSIEQIKSEIIKNIGGKVAK